VPDAGHHRRLPRPPLRPEQGPAIVHDPRDRRRAEVTPAEFDRHAGTYDGGLDNPIKRMMGGSADQFIAVKARWLLRREPGLKTGREAVLDYGCGAGDLMRVLGELGARGSFTGCDISSGMLAEVGKRWPASLGPPPALATQEGARTPFADRQFDIVTISAVLH